MVVEYDNHSCRALHCHASMDDWLCLSPLNSIERLGAPHPSSFLQGSLQWPSLSPGRARSSVALRVPFLRQALLALAATGTAATIRHVAIACDWQSRAAVIADVVRLYGKSGPMSRCFRLLCAPETLDPR